MNDRLTELTKGVARSSSEEVNEEDIELADKEVNEAGKEVSDQFMSDFFEEVNSIKTGMAAIRKSIKQIDEISKQALVSVSLDQGAKISQELDSLIDQTNISAADVRSKLTSMDADIKKMGQDKKQAASAEFRIRVNMHQTLTRKFLDLMTEYQEVQTMYKNKYKERVERQYKLVKPNATQEEIEEALESGNTQIFAQEILLDKRHSQAKEALQYIENRHKDILRLEQSINELHQLFLDMAVLVEAQGELIDQIEYNVSQTVAYTKEGVNNLRGANKYAKKSRKKMCILIVILVVVLVFLLAGGGGLLGGLLPSRSSPPPPPPPPPPAATT